MQIILCGDNLLYKVSICLRALAIKVLLTLVSIFSFSFLKSELCQK